MIEIIVSVKVACGYTHTLALTNKGEIYAWGNNSKGQIGVNNKMKHYDPIKVTYGLLRNFLIIAMISGTKITKKDTIVR